MSDRPAVGDKVIIPLTLYDETMARLNSLDFSYSPIPSEVLQLASKLYEEKERRPMSQINLTALPPELLTALLPFQMQGLEFALEKDGKCIIGDEMGLGKTIQVPSLSCFSPLIWKITLVTY